MRLLFALTCVLLTSTLFAQPTDTSKIYTSDSSQTGLFEMVDVKPAIDQKVWRKLIIDSLQHTIENAAINGIKLGVYVVKVQFIVEPDGSILEIKVLNDPGYDLARGSENVMRASPKWNPAEKNGKKVRCYHIQPITFVIQEQ
jgi:periplasmic protein TonB